MLVGATATLEQLLAIEPGRHWVASCYIRLLPQDRSRERYLIQLKSHRTNLARALAAPLADREPRSETARDLDAPRACGSAPPNLQRAVAYGLRAHAGNFAAMARAMETRIFMPPESSRG